MIRVCILCLIVTILMASEAFCQSTADSTGEWAGGYTCVQGETSLRLSIKTEPNGTLSALFRFGGAPANRSVPNGCFVMTGAFDPDTRKIILYPQRWLLHPPGFVMVGLEGKLDSQESHFSGRVAGGSECTTFELERSERTEADDGFCGSAPALMAQR